MDPNLRRLLLLLAFALVHASSPADTTAAVRVVPDGAPAFQLMEVAVIDGARWYDAEHWLRLSAGTTEWDSNTERLEHRDGGRRLTLTAGPPYALRGGLPLAGAPANRLIDGRLAVSERFLVERASDFLGQRQSVEPVHGTGALRVALDPAHGGADRGSAAAGAPAEKEAVLQLALEVASRLRKKGFDVRLTREDDRPMTLAERAAFANRWQADLFLSFHASGAVRSQARGFEVFLAEVPRTATSDRLWAEGQVGRIGESRRWAEAVRSEAGRVLASFDRGLREMPSPLLEAVTAPACLLEAGNLSWPEDVAVFTKPQARGALAAAIAEAAVAFFRTAP